MKKILFIIIVFLIVFLIYYFNIDKNIYYVSIGDHLSYGINNNKIVNNNYNDNIKNYYNKRLTNYVNYSSINDYRVMDLINDINNNKTVIYNNNEYKVQNLLIKANVITISMGMNELIYKVKTNDSLIYEYTEELLNDIDNLLILVRKYNKDKIYFLSFYNIIDNNELIKYTNNRLKSICNKNKIQYVDISNLDNYILKDIYPTNDGYTYITNRIITLLK